MGGKHPKGKIAGELRQFCTEKLGTTKTRKTAGKGFSAGTKHRSRGIGGKNWQVCPGKADNATLSSLPVFLTCLVGKSHLRVTWEKKGKGGNIRRQQNEGVGKDIYLSDVPVGKLIND